MIKPPFEQQPLQPFQCAHVPHAQRALPLAQNTSDLSKALALEVTKHHEGMVHGLQGTETFVHQTKTAVPRHHFLRRGELLLRSPSVPWDGPVSGNASLPAAPAAAHPVPGLVLGDAEKPGAETPFRRLEPPHASQRFEKSPGSEFLCEPRIRGTVEKIPVHIIEVGIEDAAESLRVPSDLFHEFPLFIRLHVVSMSSGRYGPSTFGVMVFALENVRSPGMSHFSGLRSMQIHTHPTGSMEEEDGSIKEARFSTKPGLGNGTYCTKEGCGIELRLEGNVAKHKDFRA